MLLTRVAHFNSFWGRVHRRILMSQRLDLRVLRQLGARERRVPCAARAADKVQQNMFPVAKHVHGRVPRRICACITISKLCYVCEYFDYTAYHLPERGYSTLATTPSCLGSSGPLGCQHSLLLNTPPEPHSSMHTRHLLTRRQVATFETAWAGVRFRRLARAVPFRLDTLERPQGVPAW